MKKVNKSNSVPNGLDTYQKSNPNATWQEFTRNNRNGKKEVDECLKRDQRKLCAYCEITLSEFNGQGLDDFHVEHYYPKTPHSNHPQNWALDWNNLLAVCTGGRCKDIGKSDLFTSPDTSCDVPKDNKNLVGIILNPLIVGVTQLNR